LIINDCVGDETSPPGKYAPHDKVWLPIAVPGTSTVVMMIKRSPLLHDTLFTVPEDTGPGPDE
jgi:hypothetical protein